MEYIVAGLGNPGKEYEGSRHNAGFMGMEALADRLHVKIDRVKFNLRGQADIGGRRTLLLMPQTFMNLSGEAVREAMQFYKIPPERTVILFDDISLPVGTVRVRRKGSDGGSGDEEHYLSYRQRSVPPGENRGGGQAASRLRFGGVGAVQVHQGGGAPDPGGGGPRGHRPPA